MPTKKRTKYKLLLDEGLPLPTSYPTLNSYHDMIHIAQTKNRGKKDQDIYKLANNESRISVVFNVKDFKPLISEKTMSIIALSPNITNRQADLKIHKALNELKTNELKGCLISITVSGIRIERILEEEDNN